MGEKTAITTPATQVMYDRFHFAAAIRSGEVLYCSGTIGTGPLGRTTGEL